MVARGTATERKGDQRSGLVIAFKEEKMEILLSCLGFAALIWVVSVIVVFVLMKRAPEGEEIEGVGFVLK